MSKRPRKDIAEVTYRHFRRIVENEAEEALQYIFQPTTEASNTPVLTTGADWKLSEENASVPRFCDPPQSSPQNRLSAELQPPTDFCNISDDEENWYINFAEFGSDEDPVASDEEYFDDLIKDLEHCVTTESEYNEIQGQSRWEQRSSSPDQPQSSPNELSPTLEQGPDSPEQERGPELERERSPELERGSSNSPITEHVSPNNLTDRPASGETEDMKNFLQHWKCQFGIPHYAVTALLGRLQQHPCYDKLPRQSKTLMETPRGKVNLTSIGLGKYVHLDLVTGIKAVLSSGNYVELQLNGLDLSIFFDGIPIWGTGESMQAIVGSVKGLKSLFLIGAYYGVDKPATANEILRPTVEELKDVCCHGVTVNEIHYECRLYSVIADAPARAYILQVKSHTGFHSCTRCQVKGKKVNNRVCFPGHIEKSRTDQDFRERVDPEHHVGDTILIELPDFNIVFQIPLEYMHLICLGNMRKLLYLWLSHTKHTFCLSAQLIKRLSSLLVNCKNYVPSEFSRKPRSLQLVKRFKATEYRLLLLYVGPVVFKEVLQEDIYNHFIVLHVSVRILSSKDYIQHIDYAEQLLKEYVPEMANLYHECFISYNVHALLHVVEDVRRYGTLDEYSAFKYENFLQFLKKLIKKYGDPLQQLYNRLNEVQCYKENKSDKTDEIEIIRESQIGHCILPNRRIGPSYTKAASKNFQFEVQSTNDNCCLMKDGDVVIITNFSYHPVNKETIICGKKFKRKENLYVVPCESSLLDIYVVSHLSEEKIWSLDKIKNKMFVLPYKSKNVVLPLLHNECG